MSSSKIVLIVSDGTEKTVKMAQKINGALKNCKVIIKTASEYTGTDLLPADVLFIGCEEPSPPGFGYIDVMLQHINLAGRSCGVFSPSSKNAIQYLNNMLKSSEIKVCPQPLIEENSSDVEKWAARVISF